MPRKRRVGRPKVHRKQHGGDLRGFIGKIGNALGKANDFLKRTKLVSKVSGAASSLGIPYADKIHKYSTIAGYGKRKRRRGRK